MNSSQLLVMAWIGLTGIFLAFLVLRFRQMATLPNAILAFLSTASILSSMDFFYIAVFTEKFACMQVSGLEAVPVYLGPIAIIWLSANQMGDIANNISTRSKEEKLRRLEEANQLRVNAATSGDE